MCRDERWQNMSKNNFSCQHSWFLRKIVYAWGGDEKEIVPTVEKRSDVDIEALRTENMAWNMRLDGEAVRFISENFFRFWREIWEFHWLCWFLLNRLSIFIRHRAQQQTTNAALSSSTALANYVTISLADVAIHQVPKWCRLLPSTASLLFIKSARQVVMLSHLEIACGLPDNALSK